MFIRLSPCVWYLGACQVERCLFRFDMANISKIIDVTKSACKWLKVNELQRWKF